MVNINKSPHRHHTRCIHSNTLVVLSLRLSRLYHYRFVVFNKKRVHRILLFVFLLGYNTTHCPLGVPTRQSSIQSLGNARVTQKTARVPLSSVARRHYDRSPISYSPLDGAREAARATGCRSRPWVDIIWGCEKL